MNFNRFSHPMTVIHCQTANETFLSSLEANLHNFLLKLPDVSYWKAD